MVGREEIKRWFKLPAQDNGVIVVGGFQGGKSTFYWFYSWFLLLGETVIYSGLNINEGGRFYETGRWDWYRNQLVVDKNDEIIF